MKSSIDEVALQGVEFWSTVCDEEVDLAIEAAEVINISTFNRSLTWLQPNWIYKFPYKVLTPEAKKILGFRFHSHWKIGLVGFYNFFYDIYLSFSLLSSPKSADGLAKTDVRSRQYVLRYSSIAHSPSSLNWAKKTRKQIFQTILKNIYIF